MRRTTSHQHIIGIVGATGAVGLEISRVLHERNVPCAELILFASARTAGTSLTTAFGPQVVEEFTLARALDCDVLFLAVSGTFALQYVPKLLQEDNCPIIIDNSSAFRLDPNVPLIIPEINGPAAFGHKLLANPNCTTAIAAMALWPLHCAFGLRKLIFSTYQAASGAGIAGMNELKQHALAFLNNDKQLESTVFSYPLCFNVIPHIDTFQENGYTREEMKVVWELRKIFDLPQLKVSCTAVRVCTLRAHAEAITIETVDQVDPNEARAILGIAPGVRLVDEPESNKYPMPLTASAKDDVEVGRIRQNLVFGKNGLDLFVCGDQLLRGAALNAVLIAELMLLTPEGTAAAYIPATPRQRRTWLANVDQQRMVYSSLSLLGTGLLLACLRRVFSN